MGYTTASDDIHQEVFFLGSKVILIFKHRNHQKTPCLSEFTTKIVKDVATYLISSEAHHVNLNSQTISLVW
jgi:hypothetical protein